VIRGSRCIAPSLIPGKVGAFPLQRDDIVRIETAGGGGYGDPLYRDPVRVARDVQLGYLGRDQARSRYGVVLDDGGQPESGPTTQLRARLQAGRVRLTAVDDGEDEFDGTRRLLRLPRPLAEAAGVADGELIELVADSGAFALRAWAAIDPTATTLRLGRNARAVLGAAEGAAIELRRLGGSEAANAP